MDEQEAIELSLALHVFERYIGMNRVPYLVGEIGYWRGEIGYWRARRNGTSRVPYLVGEIGYWRGEIGYWRARRNGTSRVPYLVGELIVLFFDGFRKFFAYLGWRPGMLVTILDKDSSFTRGDCR
jgi:hypothetical protein